MCRSAGNVAGDPDLVPWWLARSPPWTGLRSHGADRARVSGARQVTEIKGASSRTGISWFLNLRL